jgi:hypothetical protein
MSDKTLGIQQLTTQMTSFHAAPSDIDLNGTSVQGPCDSPNENSRFQLYQMTQHKVILLKRSDDNYR